ncbi:hypothetical protein [Streptomyces sp. NBC_00334]|uniref:hypothetical protein n=1 Tax=Streptomyces sp. NBC_00334 TaxID=2975713 RepID=UPI002E2AD232|nr:hypothetical protein [Streptomyces sp. NBC_00334]
MTVIKTRRLSAKAAIVVSFLLVAVAGLATWFYTSSSQNDQGMCQRFLEHERAPSALGSAYRHDLTCAELGAAIRHVTTGEPARHHSLTQAQAMKDILVALADITDGSHSADRQLTTPLSLALADYSPDMYGILSPGRDDYLSRELPSDEAWQDGKGAHMSIGAPPLFRVMTFLSGDPEAYANLRNSLTEQVAEELPGAPPSRTEEALSPYPTVTSWVIGKMDAVAVAAQEDMGGQESAAWDKQVLVRLSSEGGTPPSFDHDPAGYITDSWRETLPEQPPADLLKVLEAQSVEMTRAWATALSTSDATRSSLVTDARKSAFSAQRSALRDFSGS